MSSRPHSYNIRPVPKPAESSQRRTVLTPVLIAVALLVVYVAYCLLRPVSELKTTVIPPVITGQVRVNIPWPANVEAAYGAVGYGLLASHDEQKPLPTASVAKTITALAVLDKKPLAPGQTGPEITMTDTDAALYNQYVAKDGSAVPVFSGETVTEYQALQAMMLPSANNMADTMAIWAFGSLANYRTFATDFVHKLGMVNTTIGSDASGYSPDTTSTANDLVHLGLAAISNPVLADIVSQKVADFPNFGPIENVNTLLGTDGIRGIKTGNTDQAGGVYLGAADITVAGRKITVVTAVIGAPSLGAAMRDSVPMIAASQSEFQNTVVVRAGQKVGEVTSAWGERSDIIANENISVMTWSGTALSPRVSQRNIRAPAPDGTTVGSLTLGANGKQYAADLTTATAIPGPTVQWRLKHPW